VSSVAKRSLILLALFFLVGCLRNDGNADSQRIAGLQRQYAELEAQYAEMEKKYQQQKLLVEDMQNRSGILPILCGGRLTTLTGDPFPTADRTAQSTIYFTPNAGNRISLYSGGRWKLFAFSELSLALTGLTSDTNYDVFVYGNAGSATLEIGSAWSNATTRSVALTSLNGVLVSSADTTRRYVGTFRSTSTTTTEDSKSKRFIWNLCNRGKRTLEVLDATDSWTYASTSWRPARNNTANKFSIVLGINEAVVGVRTLLQSGSATGMPWISSGIGIDSTTVNSAILMGGTSNPNVSTQVWAEYLGYPGAGFHEITWLETTDGSTTVTFYGDNGSDFLSSGMLGWVGD